MSSPGSEKKSGQSAPDVRVVFNSYIPPTPLALYCRRRAREAADEYARLAWLDRFHAALARGGCS